MYTLYFDGLYRGKIKNSEGGYKPIPIMCYGWVICEDGKVIARGHGIYTHHDAATSNGAEYLALIEGLDALLDLRVGSIPVTVYGDARTIIEQLQGVSQVTSPRVINLYLKARKLSKKLGRIHWKWIPRHKNRAADQLTRHALKVLENRDCQAGKMTHQFAGFRLIYGLMVSLRNQQHVFV